MNEEKNEVLDTEVTHDGEVTHTEEKEKREAEIETEVELEKGDFHGVVRLDDKIVAYEVKGIYKDGTSTYKGPLELRKNPPTLELSSDDGTVVEFPLPKQFNYSLLKTINEVNRAHLGFTKEKKVSTERTTFFTVLEQSKYLILYGLGALLLAQGGPIFTSLSLLVMTLATYGNYNERRSLVRQCREPEGNDSGVQ